MRYSVTIFSIAKDEGASGYEADAPLTLENLQQLVGGYIVRVPVVPSPYALALIDAGITSFTGKALIGLWVDEDGLPKGKAHNHHLSVYAGQDLVGRGVLVLPIAGS